MKLADIDNKIVIGIVKEHWIQRDLLRRINDYPTDCCTVLMNAYSINYKLARRKLEKLIDKGILRPLLTPCVPDRPYDV